MISVNEAIQLIRENTQALEPCSLPLREASGHVLAEDLFANVSIPSFDQSAMDGYALKFADLKKGREFFVRGEVAAGDDGAIETKTSEATRIFTGAAIPAGCDTVVMQEKTELTGSRVIINDETLELGRNVRVEGSEIKKGDLALSNRTVLSPAAVGFLAGLGLSEIKVYPKPSVYIIVTGNELQPPGAILQRGQVYESNAVMLQSVLSQLGVVNTTIRICTDSQNEIEKALQNALENSDLVLLTGGVSVGKYDFVVEATKAVGVRQLFHKVAQRPGKPLYAGVKNNKLIFGLPGNPASVLSCFYNFVVPALEKLTARQNLLERRRLALAHDFQKKIKLTQFLKASHDGSEVKPLPAQESFRLSSFAIANCLIVLPAEKMEFRKGEPVETLLLPYL